MLILITHPGFAKVLILAQPKNTIDYLTTLTSKDHLTQYSSFYIKQKINHTSTEKLKNAFEYAQLKYFSDEFDLATKLFDEIINIYKHKILNQEQNLILTKIFIFKASLSQKQNKQVYWLNKAFLQSPNLSDISFAPETIKAKWSEVKNNHQKIKLKLPVSVLKYDKIIINNHVFDTYKVDEITWPVGPIQLHMISNSFLPLTIKTNWPIQNLKLTQPQLLVSGNCLQYQIEQSFNLSKELEIYFNKDCVIPIEAQVKVENKPKPIHLFADSKISLIHPYLKSPVFWTVLAGALLYLNNKKEDSNPEITFPND